MTTGDNRKKITMVQNDSGGANTRNAAINEGPAQYGDERQRANLIFPMAGFLVGCSAVVCAAYFYWRWVRSEFFVGGAEAGTFGDSFGALNAVFSGCAIVGLIIAIFLQRKEIQLQRQDIGLQRQDLALQLEESRLQRDEMEGQKEEMRLQREILAQQSFETTFFALIESLRGLASSMTSSNFTGIVTLTDRELNIDEVTPVDSGGAWLNTVSRLPGGCSAYQYATSVRTVLEFLVKHSNGMEIERSRFFARVLRDQVSPAGMHHLANVVYREATRNPGVLDTEGIWASAMNLGLFDDQEQWTGRLHPDVFVLLGLDRS